MANNTIVYVMLIILKIIKIIVVIYLINIFYELILKQTFSVFSVQRIAP